MPDPRKIGERTPEYESAELGRALPRLLDSRRADGGVLRLLTDPGGKVGEVLYREEGTATAPSLAEEQLKLLVQGPAEMDQDFIARATVTPFRSAYWGAMEHLAARPFEQPVQITGAPPPQLETGGDWEQSIDGYGTDLHSFLASNSRSSVGYGYGAILTERKGDRGVWRWVEAESITAVEDENRILSGPSAVEVVVIVEGQEAIMRLESAERAGTRYAVAKIHPKTGQGYSQEPIDIKDLDPHVEIPLDPIPSQILTPLWFGLPPLLPCAKLDHLLVNVASQGAYAVLQTLTFLRFAKGLKEDDIDKWISVGPKLFYATTSDTADMKWVTLPSGAIEAGIKYEDHILRGVEVAGLAPMLTRMPGDEKATGIAVATGRARSGAETIKNMISSGASNAYMRLAAYAPNSPQVGIKLYSGFAASPEQMAAAEVKSRIYLDPRGGMERPEFWLAMAEHGIVDAAQVKELAEWAERANPEHARIRIERANLALAAAREGMLIGHRPGREAILDILIEAGALIVPEGQDRRAWISMLAEAEEVAGFLNAGLEPLGAAGGEM